MKTITVTFRAEDSVSRAQFKRVVKTIIEAGIEDAHLTLDDPDLANRDAEVAVTLEYTQSHPVEE